MNSEGGATPEQLKEIGTEIRNFERMAEGKELEK